MITAKPAWQAHPGLHLPAAEKPTIYFIGVTTGKSSIMTVFPGWAEYLGLGDVAIVGVDCKIHDAPETYRRVVSHIKADPLSRGALVTTHKLDLLKASRDLFDVLDPWAELIGEVSSISKRGDRLVGHAKDPITSGLALDAIVGPGYWPKTGGHLCLLGAGGASEALTCNLLDPSRSDRPARIVISDRSEHRLNEVRHLHDRIGRSTDVAYQLAPGATDNDAVVNALPPRSVVVNATGLGKDGPGSPLTSAATFPRKSFAWDFNYRGDLVFLDQARLQTTTRDVNVVDGWVYFLHGWTRVIAEVFDVDIPTAGRVFERLSEIARSAR